ncbi:HNH endonuclease signature motif containing protein [Nocardioides deserti]|uniref:HNH nuclease domain-containing protein n=1 Tax=Nocardioides deserti TaxID=1588644 RepID=A0ABR6U799_9ACTN|nr:HNH endonuclease signature motif containing protein [Nocardioides deserti]MBC2960175.1 hypothetical protein [Nocardioides deserti]GGO74701.1 hypothetical protein GCM10012276_23290 [Nocardioides deserti]
MTLAHLATPETPLDDPADVLAAARVSQREADAAEVRVLQAAVEWCALHPTESLAESASWATMQGFGDQPVGLAGDGAPLVTEFAVVELAAALGKSLDAGRAYLSEALELRYRLPKVWAKVTGGDLPAWKARTIARKTLPLPCRAHPVRTHRSAPRDRADPAGVLRRPRRRLGHPRLADALDLEDAIAKGADRLEALGSREAEGSRRATALGDMARRQLVLEFDTDPKPMVVHVHQHPDPHTGEPVLDQVVRVENVRGFALTGQLAEWCTRAATNTNGRITVKPVIDLTERIHVEAYEVPDRLSEQTRLRDHHCVFPWCTRPATATSKVDDDHATPYRNGGPTATENIGPLCRRHHRAKTHGGWRHSSPSSGSYHWTSPSGVTYTVDHHGTHDHDTDPPEH